jgi:hypothetical protein
VGDVITNTPLTGRYDIIKAELIRRLVTLRGAARLPASDARGDDYRRPTQFLRYLHTLAGSSLPSDFLHSFRTNRLPPNTQAIIATQAQAVDDVAQQADKMEEVMPQPCVAGVFSSGDDISILTARIDVLASSRTFLEILSSAFTIADTMASKLFIALCRTVTSP